MNPENNILEINEAINDKIISQDEIEKLNSIDMSQFNASDLDFTNNFVMKSFRNLLSNYMNGEINDSDLKQSQVASIQLLKRFYNRNPKISYTIDGNLNTLKNQLGISKHTNQKIKVHVEQNTELSRYNIELDKKAQHYNDWLENIEIESLVGFENSDNFRENFSRHLEKIYESMNEHILQLSKSNHLQGNIYVLSDRMGDEFSTLDNIMASVEFAHGIIGDSSELKNKIVQKRNQEYSDSYSSDPEYTGPITVSEQEIEDIKLSIKKRKKSIQDNILGNKDWWANPEGIIGDSGFLDGNLKAIDKILQEESKEFRKEENLGKETLLTKEQQKVQTKAIMSMLGVIAATVGLEVGTGPVGAVGGVIYNAADLFQDQDLVLTIAKKLNSDIPEDFKMEKTLWDNIFTMLGIIPGVSMAVKTAKITQVALKHGIKMSDITNIKDAFKIGLGDTKTIMELQNEVELGKNFYMKNTSNTTRPLRYGESFGEPHEEFRTLKEMHQLFPKHTAEPIKISGKGNMYIEKVDNIINLNGNISPIPYELREKVFKTISELHKNNIVHGDLNLGNILFYTKDNGEISFKFIDPVGYPKGFENLEKAKEDELTKLKQTLKLNRSSNWKNQPRIQNIREENINEINLNTGLSDSVWTAKMGQRLINSGIEGGQKLVEDLMKIHKTAEKFKTKAMELFPNKFSESGELKKGKTISADDLSRIYSFPEVKAEAIGKMKRGIDLLIAHGVDKKDAKKFINNQMNEGMLLSLQKSDGTINKDFFDLGSSINSQKYDDMTGNIGTFHTQKTMKASKETSDGTDILFLKSKYKALTSIGIFLKIDSLSGNLATLKSSVIKQNHALIDEKHITYDRKGYIDFNKTAENILGEATMLGKQLEQNKSISLYHDILSKIIKNTLLDSNGNINEGSLRDLEKLSNLLNDQSLNIRQKQELINQIKRDLGIDLNELNQYTGIKKLVNEKAERIRNIQKRELAKKSQLPESFTNILQLSDNLFSISLNSNITNKGSTITTGSFDSFWETYLEGIGEKFYDLVDGGHKLSPENMQEISKSIKEWLSNEYNMTDPDLTETFNLLSNQLV